jgi:hypothetical protein
MTMAQTEDTGLRCKVIDGRSWRTPLTAQPLRTVGSARLTRKHYRGVYVYEGFDGYEFYQARGWLPVTGLQRRYGRHWMTWMVDDPLHWDGMREAVSRLPSGRILVAGLGLGLMLHHMSQDARFSSIEVIEQEADVRNLIEPTLPPDARRRIIISDFYAYIEAAARLGTAYDGILWDLGVGGVQETQPQVMRGRILCEVYQPRAALVQFGVRPTTRPLGVQEALADHLEARS